MFDYFFALAILQIIWIDVLLSGDNAVVIALACQSLPPKKRFIGLVFGVVLAVVARICMAAVISFLLGVPFLKIVGGLLLLYIAVKVIKGEDDDERAHKHTGSLWGAIGLIGVADVTMSLDNVVAIAAAAGGNDLVFIFGLIVSMPLMIVGASLISALIARWPLIVWAGGGLLGWVAGGMIASDPYVAVPVSIAVGEHAHLGASAAGVVVVIATAYLFIRLARRTRVCQV